MNKNQSTIMRVVAGLLLMGASFFAGVQYQSSIQSNGSRSTNQTGMRQQGTGQQRNFAQGGAQNGPQVGGMVTGEVIALESQSMTIKMTDGGSKIVIVAGSTSYQKNLAGSLTDVVVGGKVTIIGTANSDGSVTAKTVMLGDTLMPRMGQQPTDASEPATMNPVLAK